MANDLEATEDLLDLVSGEWAGETELANSGVSGDLADLLGGGEVESWALSWDIIFEEGQDNVVFGFGHGSGGEVANKTSVALSWFVLGDGSDGNVRFGQSVGGSLSSSLAKFTGSDGKGNTLEEDGTSEDSNT